MMEFLLIGAAVIAVMLTRWEGCSRWPLGVGGMLSMALSLRMTVLAALAAAGSYGMTPAWADAPADSSAKTEAVAVANESGESAAVVAGDADNPLLEADGPAKSRVEPAPGDPSAQAATDFDAGSELSPSSTANSNPAGKPDSAARPPVEIVTNVRYLAADRPVWLEAPPEYTKEATTVAVRAGPYPTHRACLPDLEQEIQTEVRQFINEHLGAPHASTFIRYSLKDLRQRKVIRQEFSEQLETSLGLMNQVHAQLVFDSRFEQDVERRWSEIKARSRLLQTGMGTGVVLLLLGILFSYLKLDTATKGYYTGRLQFGAAATILALVAASVVLVKWVPWM